MITRRAFAGAAMGAAASALPLPKRESMKITDVRVTLMSCELKDKSWITSTMLIWKSDAVLVEVFTDKGVVGIGESSPYGNPEGIKKTIEEYVRPVLIGKNPFDVEHIAAGWAGARPNYIAWAGVDAACWDIVGKAAGKPVWRILCGETTPQKRIRMYASGGVEYAWYDRPEALIEEAVRHKEEGYTAFKFRIGTEWKTSGMTMDKYIPWVRRLREAVGPGMDLIQESNMRLSEQECLQLCPVLEELNFAWFEEPVNAYKDGSLESHLRIKQALKKVKISGGEMRGSRFEFKEWIDRGAYDIVQPDCNVTGLSEGWQIAQVAAAQGKWCCPHNWHGGLTTMANAALVASIPNRHMLELNQTWNPFKEEIFVDPLVVKRGYMELPERPGFGMEVKKDIAKRFPFVPGNYWKPNPKTAA